jgi:hypothetical protein
LCMKMRASGHLSHLYIERCSEGKLKKFAVFIMVLECYNCALIVAMVMSSLKVLCIHLFIDKIYWLSKKDKIITNLDGQPQLTLFMVLELDSSPDQK